MHVYFCRRALGSLWYLVGNANRLLRRRFVLSKPNSIQYSPRCTSQFDRPVRHRYSAQTIKYHHKWNRSRLQTIIIIIIISTYILSRLWHNANDTMHNAQYILLSKRYNEITIIYPSTNCLFARTTRKGIFARWEIFFCTSQNLPNMRTRCKKQLLLLLKMYFSGFLAGFSNG